MCDLSLALNHHRRVIAIWWPLRAIKGQMPSLPRISQAVYTIYPPSAAALPCPPQHIIGRPRRRALSYLRFRFTSTSDIIFLPWRAACNLIYDETFKVTVRAELNSQSLALSLTPFAGLKDLIGRRRRRPTQRRHQTISALLAIRLAPFDKCKIYSWIRWTLITAWKGKILEQTPRTVVRNKTKHCLHKSTFPPEDL